MRGREESGTEMQILFLFFFSRIIEVWEKARVMEIFLWKRAAGFIGSGDQSEA